MSLTIGGAAVAAAAVALPPLKSISTWSKVWGHITTASQGVVAIAGIVGTIISSLAGNYPYAVGCGFVTFTCANGTIRSLMTSKTLEENVNACSKLVAQLENERVAFKADLENCKQVSKEWETLKNDTQKMLDEKTSNLAGAEKKLAEAEQAFKNMLEYQTKLQNSLNQITRSLQQIQGLKPDLTTRIQNLETVITIRSKQEEKQEEKEKEIKADNLQLIQTIAASASITEKLEMLTKVEQEISATLASIQSEQALKDKHIKELTDQNNALEALLVSIKAESEKHQKTLEDLGKQLIEEEVIQASKRKKQQERLEQLKKEHDELLAKQQKTKGTLTTSG